MINLIILITKYLVNELALRFIFARRIIASLIPNKTARRFIQTEWQNEFDELWPLMTDAEKKRLVQSSGHGYVWLYDQYKKKYLES